MMINHGLSVNCMIVIFGHSPETKLQLETHLLCMYVAQSSTEPRMFNVAPRGAGSYIGNSPYMLHDLHLSGDINAVLTSRHPEPEPWRRVVQQTSRVSAGFDTIRVESV